MTAPAATTPDTSAPQAPKSIYQLIAEAKRRIGPVGKEGWNGHQKYNFRGVDAVVNAVAPVFDDLGVITVPVLQHREHAIEEVGEKRSRMGHQQVTVTYRFFGPAGDCIEATVPGEAMDSGDKATAKAMSVAYRTALLQVLNLPTSERDPDEDSYELSSADYDDGDWGQYPDLIARISTLGDARKLDAELRGQFERGEVTATKARNIKTAIAKRLKDAGISEPPKDAAAKNTDAKDAPAKGTKPKPADAAKDTATSTAAEAAPDPDPQLADWLLRIADATTETTLKAVWDEIVAARRQAVKVPNPKGGTGTISLLINQRKAEIAAKAAPPPGDDQDVFADANAALAGAAS